MSRNRYQGSDRQKQTHKQSIMPLITEATRKQD
jgi:hypothetical protein